MPSLTDQTFAKGSLLFSIAIVAVVPLLLATCIGVTGVFWWVKIRT